MKSFLKKFFVVLGLSMMVATPVLVSAQFDDPGGETPKVYFSTYAGAIKYVEKAANWLLYIVIALAVVFIIYAGFLYLTSGGDDEKTKAAKNYIVYAVIGIAIALLARGIVLLAKNFIG